MPLVCPVNIKVQLIFYDILKIVFLVAGEDDGTEIIVRFCPGSGMNDVKNKISDQVSRTICTWGSTADLNIT